MRNQHRTGYWHVAEPSSKRLKQPCATTSWKSPDISTATTPNVGIDEIAAIGGIKTTHVLDYFPSNAALHAALDEKARRSVRIPIGK
jgi:hypothetical protein